MLAFALLALLSAGYLGSIAHGWRRRHAADGTRRIAVRIVAPIDRRPPYDALRQVLSAIVAPLNDQPRALPLAASIVCSTALLILTLDPLFSDPLWSARLTPAAWRATAGWVPWLWVGTWLVLALGLPVASFFAAPLALSRHWLVLHPDGSITAQGAALPAVAPTLQPRIFDGITMPRDHGPPAVAQGLVIVLADATIAIDTRPYPGGTTVGLVDAVVPRTWYRVDVPYDDAPLAAFMRRHYPPGSRAVPPGMV
ncbi:MAG: hypothetical protein KGS47_11070 [Chloroflexi bacterium]|nr:hypothetical protein [Chloroflexota bacterium]